MRARQGRRPVLPAVLTPVVVAIAVGAYFGFGGGSDEGPNARERQTVECRVGPDMSRAVFLADLRKPLDPDHAALAGALLRQAALEIDAGTELGVYVLSPHAETPRTLLGRLCKPVDLAGLAAETAKHRAADECDLPAQAPPAARASAKDYCRQRDMLARLVDALAVETLGRPPGPTHLVEAFEATAREFGATSGTLYVFSDLIQHAQWFSHAETPHPEWEYERMAAAWSALPMEEPLRGLPPGTAVRIHYVPRTGTTDEEDARAAHKRFWEGYFVGADVAFGDQPTMAGYLPASLVEVPTAMELAAYELERLRHSGALVERERAEMEQERAQLARERASVRDGLRQLEADRERLGTEQRELAAARERVAARERDLAAAAAPSQDGTRLAAGETAVDTSGGGI